MSEQQMPARIYIRTPLFGGLEFVRADIAERMAEALENAQTAIDQLRNQGAPCALWDDIERANIDALSAFRSATQDTEARHD